MSWHFIIDDPNLGAMEKLVLLTVRRHQFGDAAVMLHQTVIAVKSGISLRATQSALAAAEEHGCLEVTRNKNHASLYRVTQKQGLMFSNANFYQPEKSSVAAMERGHRGQGQAPCTDAASRDQQGDAPGASPGLFGTQVVRTFIRKSSINSNTKTRAEVRPIDPKNLPVYEQKRQIEAKNARLSKEAEAIRETRIGKGPEAIMPVKPEYMEFARLRDSGKIKEIAWGKWKSLSSQERSNLLVTPGPETVPAEIREEKTAAGD